MTLIAGLALAAFPLLLIAAALSDVTTMTISNHITGALAAAFIPAALFAGLPWSTALACLGLGVCGLAVGAGMFALRWIGGGDAKLLAASSLWLGLDGISPFLTWTAVAGGLFGLGVIMARTWCQPYAPHAPRWVGRLLEPRGDIPYGVAIAAGGLAAFPQCALIHGFSGIF